MARPTKKNPEGAQISPKRSPEALLKLEQAFSLGCSDPEACFYAGIAPSTYYLWCKDEPEISERLKALKNKPILLARQKVVDDIKENVDTAKWYLERKCKNEFTTRTENTHNITAMSHEEWLSSLDD